MVRRVAIPGADRRSRDSAIGIGGDVSASWDGDSVSGDAFLNGDSGSSSKGQGGLSPQAMRGGATQHIAERLMRTSTSLRRSLIWSTSAASRPSWTGPSRPRLSTRSSMARTRAPSGPGRCDRGSPDSALDGAELSCL